jgi:hypothetical protein
MRIPSVQPFAVLTEEAGGTHVLLRELAKQPVTFSGGSATSAWSIHYVDELAASSTAPVEEWLALMTTLATEAVRRDRRLAARAFARAVEDRPGVEEIGLLSLYPDFVVGVVTEDSDLDRDLELHAVFVDIAQSLDDPTAAVLDVFSRSRGIPDRFEAAEKLK